MEIIRNYHFKMNVYGFLMLLRSSQRKLETTIMISSMMVLVLDSLSFVSFVIHIEKAKHILFT